MYRQFASQKAGVQFFFMMTRHLPIDQPGKTREDDSGRQDQPRAETAAQTPATEDVTCPGVPPKRPVGAAGRHGSQPCNLKFLEGRCRQIDQILIKPRNNPSGNIVFVHSSIPLSFRNAANACVAREQ